MDWHEDGTIAASSSLAVPPTLKTPMQNALADTTDFDEGSEKTEIDRSREVVGIFDMIEEPVAESRYSRAQTELDEVPESLWFESESLIGSEPISLASPPVVQVQTTTADKRARVAATPTASRPTIPSALLWEYLGLVIAAVSSVLVFGFVQSTGAVTSAMLLREQRHGSR